MGQNAVYEKKIIQDSQFPVEVLFNDKERPVQLQRLCIPHWHEHLELHFVLGGELEVVQGQDPVLLKTGEMAVINGNEIHTTRYKDRMEEIIFIFRTEDLSPELAEQNIRFCQKISADTLIRDLVETVRREFLDKRLGWKLACKGLFLQLLAHLSRNYVETRLEDRQKRRSAEKMERISLVTQYIDAHCDQSLGSDVLAQKVHLSEDRFNHWFRENMGMPPGRYVNEVRLHKALELLRSGNYLASEAAEMAGFTDYNYFGRLFRRTFGCTPSQAAKGTDAISETAILYEDTAVEC